MSSETMPIEPAPSPEISAPVAGRTAELLGEHRLAIWRTTDRMFAALLFVEWIAGIVWAVWRTPFTWEGPVRSVHPHVWQAVILGGLIAALPIYLVFTRAGTTLTRHCVAVSQMLSSALLIHISGGRIETHFHVFGSLAFLAFYRDWRVLISATVVVALDHMVRNLYLPESVYGVLVVSPWRWLEHAAWVVFEDIILIAGCLRGVNEMQGIAQHRALQERSRELVEEKVRQRTEQLRQAQDDLLKVARQAGMAEIATSVLHNVGNVLNSVNVSLRTATSKVQQSPVGQLAKAVDMMREHKTDLGQYLQHDDRGRLIPEFLEAVAETLSSEQSQMLEEMSSLAKNVDHIKEIVNVQQSHARGTGMLQRVDPAELLEDAIKVTLVEAPQTRIKVDREYGQLVPLETDKHVTLQILINLFSNAKHALMAVETQRRIRVRCEVSTHDDADWMRMEVIDNGAGIEASNLTRIFNHGFTTKKDGHGFGLHASANGAKRLGGTLSAYSDGPGAGARFILELPLRKEPVAV